MRYRHGFLIKGAPPVVGVISRALSMRIDPQEPIGLPELLIVQGIRSVLAEAGVVMLVGDPGPGMSQLGTLLATFAAQRFAGVILVAEYHQAISLPRLRGPMQMVMVNCFDNAGTASVLPDDWRGQYDLVQRLIRAGHRRIGFLTLRPEIVAGRLRLSGYRAALKDAGIEIDPDLVEDCDFTDQEGEMQLLWDSLDRLLHNPEPPTVLCCGNDRMAAKVYQLLTAMGLRIPQDISVAGFDNHRMVAETLDPPLTTVDLPYSAMGVRAADRLLSLMAGHAPQLGGPMLVTGPVHWRGSVQELRSGQVTTLRPVSGA
ncbi:substrate-binding domain-containing protein [Stagnihabitans tardus]|uniref:substrate-binding domain-containing protein n=1 Tax=Stagnihabitans tardus TaxID=2699202 RepID=UPI0022391DD4|nr:substrate-binding domain-containing protein [Stagnihabitans tardus]